ncbi:MAG: three-Cys-motif partner protein TcmP [Bacteroidales bacterium]
MAKNINDQPFDESTKLKLEIFGESFKEWFPVFINDPYTKEAYVFDFFAGSGKDLTNYSGSPLILLDKAKGDQKQFCNTIRKKIHFIFNEALEDKYQELKKNVDNFIGDCKRNNNCRDCVFNIQVMKFEFQEIFKDKQIQNILNNKKIGKFVLLDQYGFKEINDIVFLQLIEFPKTDFIFFISSSFIKRFKEHPNTKKYIDTEKINFDLVKPNECHRIIAEYFKQLIPLDKEYYIHHFTIQKEIYKGNFYGLIFGSNHTLGMEKFLKTCWKTDPFSGEANFNIDNNFENGTLFYNPITSNKKEQIKQKIKKEILNETIQDNISGMKFSMQNGCEPKLFTEVIKELEKQKRITRYGDINYSSTNIHKVKNYCIKLAK